MFIQLLGFVFLPVYISSGVSPYKNSILCNNGISLKDGHDWSKTEYSSMQTFVLVLIDVNESKIC